MPPLTVSLAWDEAFRAAVVGAMRRLVALYKERGQWDGWHETTWSQDIEAAGAELAVAKTIGRFWNGDIRAHGSAPDAGDVHVRHTEHEHGHLPLHDHDAGAEVYVLVTGRMPTYHIVGFTTGDRGRAIAGAKTALTPTGRPAFWVPQDELRDPAELSHRHEVTAG